MVVLTFLVQTISLSPNLAFFPFSVGTEGEEEAATAYRFGFWFMLFQVAETEMPWFKSGKIIY